jgi:SAM-dependent methyltransferase
MRALLSDLRSYYRGSRGRDQVEFYDLESRLPYFDHVNRILCREKRRVILEFLLPPGPGEDPILDVGCGIGTMARVLSGRGEEVVGLDISPRKIARARAARGRAERGRIRYVTGDLRGLGERGSVDRTLSPEGAPRFRRIIAADVLEHVPDEPAETAARLRRLLPPGGQLVASVPSRLCIRDPGHIWRLLPAEWEEVFVKAGLEPARRRMSRVYWFRLRTPLHLAMVFDLRRVA